MTTYNGLTVQRRLGVAGQYAQHLDGRFLTLNPQRGWVFLDPANSPALRYAIKEDLRKRFARKSR